MQVATGKPAKPGHSGVWAFNPVVQEWQAVHAIVSGDNLWNMSRDYYGQPSQAGMHAIRDVPENTPIVGQDMKQAIPGDQLLIPGIAARSGLGIPGGPPPPGTGGTVDPAPTLPGLPPGVAIPPGIIPPGFPTIPGVTGPAVGPGGEPVPTVPPGVPGVPPVATLPPVQVEPPAVLVGTEEEKKAKEGEFWTPTKIAVGAGLGILVVGGIAYFATRPKKRTRRRRK
jgi:hypothetical protein